MPVLPLLIFLINPSSYLMHTRALQVSLPMALLFSCLLLFLGFCCSEVTALEEATTVIVGAGISGIMAAKTLSEGGVKDFIILEATDRIGGRMHKYDVGGHTIELGANWVEGVGGDHVNPILTLAQKYNLTTFKSDWNSISRFIYKQDGRIRYNKSEVEMPYKMASLSSDFCERLSKSLSANKENDLSIKAAQGVYGKVPQTPLEMVIDYFFYDFETAEPPRVTSLKNVEPTRTFSYYGNDVYFVADPRGYEHVPRELAKEFLKHNDESFNDPRLKLNQVVRKIEYSDNGVNITTEDESVYRAKNTIVSVSLGVLQSDLIQFLPRLPVWKRMAISKFDLADYCKIFMKFPKRFWPVEEGGEFFLYTHQKRGYYPLWQHLEREYPGGNLLMVTVTDEESKRIQQQPDNDTRAEIMDVLRSMFGNDIPEMESIIVPRWGMNRFYKGTFTNWPIGASPEEFNQVKAPLGPVYFTGEHTSQYFNGYVHGAYLEGISCAQSVLKCLNQSICPARLLNMNQPPREVSVIDSVSLSQQPRATKAGRSYRSSRKAQKQFH